ncbi:MAG TPA: putative peptidoglycan glycosyltransferase FtsW, partial [Rectinemataceae bacterium]|nr:putative peptidoglycan glycosyltransferase FtsW [Rectinemataceae bacterium]
MATGFDVERMKSAKAGDPALLAAILLLAGLGMATLWSASAGYAISLGKGGAYFVVRQSLYLLPSILVFIACAFIPLESIRSKIGPITLIGLASLLLPFIPGLGENRNGAARWIRLGIVTFQPSEFWKPLSVLYLAHVLDRRSRRIQGGEKSDEAPASGVSSATIIAPFLLVSLGCLLIYLQNDFSTAIVSAISALVVFWIAGAPPLFFFGIGASAAPLAILSILTSDFRLRRIMAFMFPAYEPHGQGYQVLGSIRAIRSGGFFGKGIGLGTLKLASVPEVQSDFVFSAWSEETGFFGVLAFFTLWAFLAWRALRVAFREEDGFRSYLGFGLVMLLLFEVLVNVAVAAGAVPATGMALPFFSAGGSALLASAGCCGLLYNLSRASVSRDGPVFEGRVGYSLDGQGFRND